jgi:hypothetical protein
MSECIFKIEQDSPREFELDEEFAPPKIRWRGKTVEVTARLVPRYLWTTASIDVFLEGRCILRTGGQLKMIGSSSAEFDDDGSVHTVELSWGSEHQLTFPYQLRISDAKVAVSNVPVQNPEWLLMPVLILVSPLLAGFLASWL